MKNKQTGLEQIDADEPTEVLSLDDLSINASCYTGRSGFDVLTHAFEKEQIKLRQDGGLEDIHLSLNCSGDGIEAFCAGISLTEDEAKELGTALIDAAGD
ncbi:hypothetical protein [Haloquadratum walsbyi]|jgi:hypothetical protein|uniref:Uncharacterized protein n=1 Tax=Haloquadratum walsbyi J07HQW2 TaxID=1238425 RepID=U1PKT7_9EURY|nr:hypothetical protein [Haloquadratum walsbyi]ERG94307.1 MAG: hypothetical protein J07HQW2_00741 [Haloquadratum walsbyi J07HQW2]